MGKAMDLALVLLCVVLDGTVLAVPRSTDSVSHTAAVQSKAVKAVPLSSCYLPYVDLRAENRLDFSADKTATRKSNFVGNNSQLQCTDHDACSSSGYLRSAYCYNYKPSYSEPEWTCYGYFPRYEYTLGKTRLDCEESPTSRFCVLEDSCILLYTSYKPLPIYLYFLMFTAAVFCVYIFVLVWRSIRSRNSRNSTETPRSTQTTAQASRTAAGRQAPATQISYNAAADVPPSYSTVERNPKRFEKPRLKIFAANVTDGQPSAETPPPTYDTISG